MRTSTILLTATLAIILTISTAHARPPQGSKAPNVRVQSVAGQTFDSGSLKGNTTLIFYENKDVTSQNHALKAALRKQKAKDGHGDNVQIIAVADVSAWNFWPVKGFVQNAIREEEKKVGHPIYLDWTGNFGKAFAINKSASNVILIGSDKKIRLTHAGPVPAGKALEVLKATGK